MQLETITDPARLEPERWDRLAHPSLYLSSDWLRARSRTVKAAGRLALLSDRDGPLAAAACYLSDENAHPGYFPPRLLGIDCLDEAALGSPAQAQALAQFRAQLKQGAADWSPSLVVAAPGRYGGASFRAGLDAQAAARARAQLVEAIEDRAQRDAARSLCWLYLIEGEDPLLEAALAERGYGRLILDAECYMPLPWDDFDGYLDSFRAEYRGTVKHEMAAFDAAGVQVELRGADALDAELAALERQWRLKYGRTPELEEIVADYDELRAHLSDRLRVFVAVQDGRAIGFSVFLDDGETWYSRFGGFSYDEGNLFLYFNLLFYRPLQAMIGRGVRVARYSLKSYEAKRSRGCLLRHVLAFVKPPPDWPSMRPVLDLLDHAQAKRFAQISRRRISKR